MKWYRNFLHKVCNPRTKQWYWVLIEATGFLIMFCWALAALPLVGAFARIDFLGHIEESGFRYIFVAYNGLFHLAGNAAFNYYLIIFLCIVFVKLSMLFQVLGNNYKKGYIYILPSAGRPYGEWKKI